MQRLQMNFDDQDAELCLRRRLAADSVAALHDSSLAPFGDPLKVRLSGQTPLNTTTS
jgi:hypothetical protein